MIYNMLLKKLLFFPDLLIFWLVSANIQKNKVTATLNDPITYIEIS